MVDSAYHLLGGLFGDVHGNADGVVHPFLNGALHTHFVHPVDVVGRGFVVGRFLYDGLQLLVVHIRHFVYIVVIDFQPLNKFGVKHGKFLESVAVGVFHNFLGAFQTVVGIYLATTVVSHKEHRLNARSSLCTDTYGTRWGYGEQCYVAASVLVHFGVEFGVGLGYAADEGIVLLAVGVVERERLAFLSHSYRRAVGRKCEVFLHIDGKVDGLGGAVAQSHSSKHIALGGDAETGATAFHAFVFDVQPQVVFHKFHLVGFGVVLYLFKDFLYFFEFKVYKVVHQALGFLHMGAEKVEVELGLRRERIFHISVEVDGQQTAAVVRAQRNFTAGVGGDGGKAFVGIAVGHRLADYGVPEKHTGFGHRPCVSNNLIPKGAGVYLFDKLRIGRIDGVLLNEGLVFDGATHKFVGDFHRDVGTSDFAHCRLGVDKLFGVGVFDGDAEHKRAASSALRHLAGGVGETFHKRHYACGSEGAVFHRRAFGTDMREVVSHTAATFHQLHLLLVGFHNAAVGVAKAGIAYHKAVGKRHYLEIVADTRHGTALRNDIAEAFEQLVNLVLRHGVGVLGLDAGELRSYAVVHIVGGELVDVFAVAQGVFINPHIGCKFVATEIFYSGLSDFVHRVNGVFPFHFGSGWLFCRFFEVIGRIRCYIFLFLQRGFCIWDYRSIVGGHVGKQIGLNVFVFHLKINKINYLN